METNNFEIIAKYEKLYGMDKIKNDLLYYELCNPEICEHETVVQLTNEPETVINFVKEILVKYNIHILETQLEDEEWSFHDKSSSFYELGDNEYVYENTLKNIHVHDITTKKYLQNIVNYIHKHVSKIGWTFVKKIVEISDGICLVLLILKN
jgi:hypothetical protein